MKFSQNYFFLYQNESFYSNKSKTHYRGEGKQIVVTQVKEISQEHVRPSQDHVRSSQEHVRSIQEHVRSSQEHVRSSQEQVRSSQEHVRASQEHVRNISG